MGLNRRRSWVGLINSVLSSAESLSVGLIKPEECGKDEPTCFTFAKKDGVSPPAVEGGTHWKRCKAAVWDSSDLNGMECASELDAGGQGLKQSEALVYTRPIWSL